MSSTYGTSKTPSAIRMMQRVVSALEKISPNLAGWASLQLFSMPVRRARPDFATLTHQPEKHLIHEGPYRIMTYSWGTGPILLLVHGWEANADRFLSFVQPLVEAGFRVVAVDGHAHGASGGRLTNYLRSSDALAAVIRKVGAVHGVVAHSFGAGVTMALLARHPSIRFNRVVLIASVNRLSDMMALFRQRMRLSESVDRAFFGHALRLVKQPLEIFDVENIARQRGEAALIIHDRDDEIVPCSSGQAIAQAWPGAQYHETQKLGHRRILKNDAVIQLVSDFMSVK